MEHDEQAERLEREAQDMEKRAAEVGDRIEETKRDWEAKEDDPSVPGAARRAAAMKLDELTGSLVLAAISLIAISEAAIRSDGEDMRAAGRVPGSSG